MFTWNRRVKTSWMRTFVLVSSLETTRPEMEETYKIYTITDALSTDTDLS